MPIIVARCPAWYVPERGFALPGKKTTGLRLAGERSRDRPPLPHPARRRRRRSRPRGRRRDGAQVAAEDGIEAVCATPHIRHDHDVRIQEVARPGGGAERAPSRGGRPARRPAKAARSPRPRSRTLSEEELSRVALGAGSWILLEPAPGPLTDNLLAAVEHLAERGHRSLIAHPERHLSADMFERMAALVGDGALVQATADFFLREEMAAGMVALAEAGPGSRAQQRLAHFARRPAAAADGRRWRSCARSSASRRTWSGSPRPRRGRSSKASRSTVPFDPGSPRLKALRRAGAARPARASSSTTERAPVPRPLRRKLAAPAAAPILSVSSQSRPAASAAASAAHHRVAAALAEPRSKRGGTSSQASPSRITIAGSSARVTIAAAAPCSSSRSAPARSCASRVDGPVDERGQLPVVDLDQVGLSLKGAVEPGGERSTTTGVPLARTSATRLP